MGRLTNLGYVFTFLLSMVSINSTAAAQYYYVNGYSMAEDGLTNNVIYKISLETVEVIDSIVFDRQGEFTSSTPISLQRPGSDLKLLVWVGYGLPGKNSIPDNPVLSYYWIINERNFKIAGSDSLLNNIVLGIKPIGIDSVEFDCIGFSQDKDVLKKYTFDRDNNSFRMIEQTPYNEIEINNERIGDYIFPHYLAENNQRNYYYDFLRHPNIYIFSTQNNIDVSKQINAGDLSQESVILGYSPEYDNIYCFNFRYKILAMYPHPESPDSISNTLRIINGETFDVINTINFELGDIYLPKEYNKADYQDGYLIHYFAKSDGYGRYDPAYLLIFNTRTNEASWLRVGWR